MRILLFLLLYATAAPVVAQTEQPAVVVPQGAEWSKAIEACAADGVVPAQTCVRMLAFSLGRNPGCYHEWHSGWVVDCTRPATDMMK